MYSSQGGARVGHPGRPLGEVSRPSPLREVLLRAGGADAVRDRLAGDARHVALDAVPEPLVVAHLLAVGADRDQLAQLAQLGLARLGERALRLHALRDVGAAADEAEEGAGGVEGRDA